jgi:hypothetical protein
VKYAIAARLPDGEKIVGAKEHRSMASVKRQLLQTAPQWRGVFPGIEFEIQPVEGEEPGTK